MADKFYYELADKGIISENDAGYASGTFVVIPIEILGPDGSPANINDYISVPGYAPVHVKTRQTGSRVFIKDVSRTDENAYKREWERFKSGYNREIITWEDAVQENIDFERYLKDNSDSRDITSQWHFDKVSENLEKTKNVIFQIFG
ncbi:MAG: hypothetical protein K2J72_03710 [Oscillospiraceae bacterium]|nr:hypothetical protein [Oscillospiraceae bacterium]